VISLGRKKPALVGIDITSTSVKLIELSKSGNRYKVENYSVEPLPANAVVDKNIADTDAVANSVAKALKRSGAKAKRCAMAIPASSAISKQITMPSNMSEDDMEGQIQLEADQYIPYSLDEVNLDFEVLGASENNPNTVDVLIAASRKEIIESRCAVAETTGLDPTVMDIESYATGNAYGLIGSDTEGDSDQVAAVIDIGATMTSISVVQGNQLIYTREQPFGGQQLTEEIMRRYGLSYAEAGLAKKEGGLPDNYVPEILNNFKDTLAQQAHRLLQFFFAASQHNEVSEIILAGGCAGIPNVDELIEQRTHTKTTIANPFSHMNFASRINQQRLGNDAPALMIAVGLALRSFD
jgi:type IV pilus assembly protein PilM